LKNLVLSGNATIGGTQRWDIRDVIGGLDGAGFTLTKTGVNDIWFKDLGETGLGGISITQGLLGSSGSTRWEVQPARCKSVQRGRSVFSITPPTT
jgi:hypothetical protein